MIQKNIGFIGCGNMGKAILNGLLSSSLIHPKQIMAATKTNTSALAIQTQFQISATTDILSVAKFSDILFLAIKPNLFSLILPAISNSIKEDCLIISIAAGQTMAQIEALFQKPIHLIRCMPNTPALVNQSMTAFCQNTNISSDEQTLVYQLLESFGKAEQIPESLMDAVVGVSGSSPAYVYQFIEAMADAAVADGMPRTMAYKFAAQSVLGAAKMVLETGKHPGTLKDEVCSPSGTTIEAVSVLEEEGMRRAVIKAQRACVEKSREMSKK